MKFASDKLIVPLILSTVVVCLNGCVPSDENRRADDPSGKAPARQVKKILPDADGFFHIHEGDSVQAVLDAAAADPVHKHVMIHEGTYRPAYASQAMIRFHERHDGIFLEGSGQVILTAENRDVAVPGDGGYPAVVNHVVYFGHGVTGKTRLKGLRITGANGFATNSETDGPIEPHSGLPGLDKRLFFYLDGGAIKIFGKSSPSIEQVEIIGNRTILCGGGISVEQRGFKTEPVRIVNCVFRDNKCPATGSAIDLLEGSAAVIENCLFVGNIANTGMAAVEAKYGLRYNEVHGCGALTVFPGSTATVSRCTLTQNWNGADDKGDSSYRDSIFRDNTASNGSLPGGAYELDVSESVRVENCWIHGNIDDLRGTIDVQGNTLQAPDPDFDEHFEPRNPQYEGVGYRVSYAKDNGDASSETPAE